MVAKKKSRSRSRSSSRSPSPTRVSKKVAMASSTRCAKTSSLTRKKNGYLARIKKRGDSAGRYWFVGLRGGLKLGATYKTAKYHKITEIDQDYVRAWYARAVKKCAEKRKLKLAKKAGRAAPRKRSASRSRSPGRSPSAATKKILREVAAGKLTPCKAGLRRHKSKPRTCYRKKCAAGQTRDKVTKRCRPKKVGGRRKKAASPKRASPKRASPKRASRSKRASPKRASPKKSRSRSKK